MHRQRLLSCVGLFAVLAACTGAVVRSDAVAAPGPAPSGASQPAIEDAASCARAFPQRGGKALPSPGQGSTVALAAWGSQVVAYVIHEDDKAIHAIDVERSKQLGVTPLSGTPSSLLVLADGRLAVTMRDTSRLELLEPGATAAEPLALRCSLAVPTEPVSLAASPDGATLAVTSGWGHKLVAFDIATMKTRAEVDVPREPRAVVIDDDGERAFVAHVVDAKMSVVDLPTASSSSSSVRTIDLRAKKDATLQAGCQGFALAKAVTALPAGGKEPGKAAAAEQPLPRGEAPVQPDAKRKPATSPPSAPAPEQPTPARPVPVPPVRARIFAPMVTVDPGDAQQASSGGYGSPERGPTERPLVSVIDSGAERALTRTAAGDALVSSDACLLPRAAAYHGFPPEWVATGGFGVVRYAQTAAVFETPVGWCVSWPAGPEPIVTDGVTRAVAIFASAGEAEQFAEAVSQ